MSQPSQPAPSGDWRIKTFAEPVPLVLRGSAANYQHGVDMTWTGDSTARWVNASAPTGAVCFNAADLRS